MLRRLRWQLTLFYFLAAVAMVALVGAGSYALLRLYLQDSTDQALQVKMALQFRQYGLALPDALAQAEQDWLETKTRPVVATSTFDIKTDSEEEEDDDEHQSEPKEEDDEGPYDSELSPVFTVPFDELRQPILTAGNPVPLVQDMQATGAALEKGVDLRTTRLPDGRQVRLLTYRVSVPGGPALLQAGRLLQDQERILRSYLLGLLALSGLSAIFLGLGSWWLSGRSLLPAQHAWDQQQAFISNASHELRTPLTLIRASAEYLQRNPDEPDAPSLLGDILKESDYMNRLVDDLLLLSRLDSQRLKLERESIDIASLVADVQRQAEKLAEGKSIQISATPVQGAVWADPSRLRQVLLILLDNAIRFTPAGGSIRLAARQQSNSLEIQVADTGRGIPPEHLPHIFERFYQVPGAAGENTRNNGLGLSIAKSLVEAQGGSIQLYSRVGQGTQAVITLRQSSPKN